MRFLLFLLVLLVGFSCKEENENTNKPIAEKVKTVDFLNSYELKTSPLIDTISFLQPKNKYNDFEGLEFSQKLALQLDTIISITKRGFRFYDYDKSHHLYHLSKEYALDKHLKTKIIHNLSVSKNYKTLLFYSVQANVGSFFSVINYTNDYKSILDVKVVYPYKTNSETVFYFYDSNFNIKSYYYDDGVMKTTYDYFLMDENGKISFKEKKSAVREHTRSVKASSGLIVRDSIGNQIGKLNFLDNVTIEKSSENDTIIYDQGQPIKGKKAKIILDYQAYLKHLLIPTVSYNHGYIFDGYLFDSYCEQTNFAYKNSGFSIKGKEVLPICLEDLFEINVVDISKYKNNIIKTPKIQDITKDYKQDNTLKIIADNGEKLIYNDTTYHSEYSPTKTFSLYQDQDFPNTFLVGSSMVFSYPNFIFINKENGSINDVYEGGYPYVSPNKDYVVSIDYDLECLSQRTVFIDRIKNDKIEKSFMLFYDLEDYLESDFDTSQFLNKTEEEIYWISNKEFIIKFMSNSDCYESSDHCFYLKYKLKDSFYNILEI
ncbi:hypothetical protein OOZ35_05195 [Mesoflavibacter profundi]|uniref:WG repeat-containing protein n=1 Tax=Mesoflavibacter profundi TaxID=2708110 RepID=A0ABT4RYJ5_9FLAO|nr:hypothetical protein [Mesoflavibacter profundi]MDA0176887.1 hypothetical protein [Mesoflavibacter profundi]